MPIWLQPPVNYTVNKRVATLLSSADYLKLTKFVQEGDLDETFNANAIMRQFSKSSITGKSGVQPLNKTASNKCAHCNKDFVSAENLALHIASDHSAKKDSKVCHSFYKFTLSAPILLR